MPTGVYVRRRKDNQWRIEYSMNHLTMYHWMDWVAKTKNVKIQHKLNSGSEKRIVPYLADGYSAEDNTVYEVRYILLCILKCVYDEIE